SSPIFRGALDRVVGPGVEPLRHHGLNYVSAHGLMTTFRGWATVGRMSASVASAEWRDQLAGPPRRDLPLAFALAVVALLQVLWFLPIGSRPVGALVAVVSTVPL